MKSYGRKIIDYIFKRWTERNIIGTEMAAAQSELSSLVS